MPISSPILTAFFDGSCGPPNPGGPAGYGFVIYRGGRIIAEGAFPCLESNTSNNLAEYCGFRGVVLYLFNKALDDTETVIYGDSKLVVEQMSGRWKLSGGVYHKTALDSKRYLDQFRKPPLIKWIPRDQNIYADALSKEGCRKAKEKARAL